MDVITVTQEDIDGLAQKFDEFADVLSDREKSVLYGVLGLAGQAVDELVAAGDQGAGPDAGEPADLPALSTQFKEAFDNGVGTRFRFETPSEAEAISIKVSGDWSR